MKALVLLVLAASLAGCAHLPFGAREFGPSGPATVAGRVSSDRGAVLADVRVVLSGPGLHRSATTDIAGRFVFERVPLGTYVVSATAAGFRGAKQTLSVDKEGTVRVEFRLRM